VTYDSPGAGPTVEKGATINSEGHFELTNVAEAALL
jgi:hypothetical protein